MIRLRGVRKRYRGRGEVLAGIDLDLTPGRPTVVVGGNGAGKSTLLRVVAGVSGPSAGRVTGRPPVVGYLPGRFPAATRMSTRAYLRHVAAIHGTRTDPAVLDELGFTGDPDAAMGELSTGDARKVALAQALAADAPLLVLDEPWSNLDEDAAAAVDAHLTRRAASVLLLADHSGRAARLPGAGVLALRDGVLVAGSGPPGPETVVELHCPQGSAVALRRLPAVAARVTGPESVTVRVPVERGDALLTSAIAAGCSVLAVRREPAR